MNTVQLCLATATGSCFSRRWRLLSLVSLLAFVSLFPSVEGEKFTGTITDSSCRHDIGQFTFVEASAYGSQPSILADISVPFICRVSHNETFAQGLTGTQLSDPDFVSQILEEDGNDIDECINAVNVYMVLAPLGLYEEDQACSAFQYTNVGERIQFQQVMESEYQLLCWNCDPRTLF